MYAVGKDIKINSNETPETNEQENEENTKGSNTLSVSEKYAHKETYTKNVQAQDFTKLAISIENREYNVGKTQHNQGTKECTFPITFFQNTQIKTN